MTRHIFQANPKTQTDMPEMLQFLDWLWLSGWSIPILTYSPLHSWMKKVVATVPAQQRPLKFSGSPYFLPLLEF
jgi:hypothetical protein